MDFYSPHNTPATLTVVVGAGQVMTMTVQPGKVFSVPDSVGYVFEEAFRRADSLRSGSYTGSMSVETFRRTIGTTPTLLYQHPLATDTSSGDYSAKHVTLTRLDPAPTKTVYIGDSSVTAATGVRWGAVAGTWDFELEPGEALYGIVDAATEPVDVIVGGR